MELEGLAVRGGTKTLKYDLPAPLGPDHGPAVFIVEAKGVSANDISARASTEEITHQARVLDRVARRDYEATNDADAFEKALADGVKWVERVSAEVLFDHFVVDWSTTLQHREVDTETGEVTIADVEPTRENWIDLFTMFIGVPAIANLFTKLRADLQTHSVTVQTVEAEYAEEETKN